MNIEPDSCPDCQVGRHRACDGLCWTYRDDRPTKCECHQNDHKVGPPSVSQSRLGWPWRTRTSERADRGPR